MFAVFVVLEKKSRLRQAVGVAVCDCVSVVIRCVVGSWWVILSYLAKKKVLHSAFEFRNRPTAGTPPN
jgi:hypothetical protein